MAVAFRKSSRSGSAISEQLVSMGNTTELTRMIRTALPWSRRPNGLSSKSKVMMDDQLLQTLCRLHIMESVRGRNGCTGLANHGCVGRRLDLAADFVGLAGRLASQKIGTLSSHQIDLCGASQKHYQISTVSRSQDQPARCAWYASGMPDSATMARLTQNDGQAN